MVQELTIMSEQLIHTKIYGHGATDILKQAEIRAAYVNNALSVAISKNQMLVVTADKEGNLRFELVSKKPIY